MAHPLPRRSLCPLRISTLTDSRSSADDAADRIPIVVLTGEK
jgi:hypothetical protein